jgi:hypothetical protein
MWGISGRFFSFLHHSVNPQWGWLAFAMGQPLQEKGSTINSQNYCYPKGLAKNQIVARMIPTSSAYPYTP